MLRASKYNVRALRCSSSIISSCTRPVCAANSGLIVPARALHSSSKNPSSGRAAFGISAPEPSNDQQNEQNPRSNWPQAPQGQWAPPRAAGAASGGENWRQGSGDVDPIRPSISGRTSNTLQPIRPPPPRFSMPQDPSSQSSSQSKLDALLRGSGTSQPRPTGGLAGGWRSGGATSGGMSEGGYQSGQYAQGGYRPPTEQYPPHSTPQSGGPYSSLPPRPYGGPAGSGVGVPPPYNPTTSPRYGAPTSQGQNGQNFPPRIVPQAPGASPYSSIPPRNDASSSGLPPVPNQFPPRPSTASFPPPPLSSQFPPRVGAASSVPPQYPSTFPPKVAASPPAAPPFPQSYPPRDNAARTAPPPFPSSFPPRVGSTPPPAQAYQPFSNQAPPEVGSTSQAAPQFPSSYPPRNGTAYTTAPPYPSSFPSGAGAATPGATSAPPLPSQNFNSSPPNLQAPPRYGSQEGASQYSHTPPRQLYPQNTYSLPPSAPSQSPASYPPRPQFQQPPGESSPPSGLSSQPASQLPKSHIPEPSLESRREYPPRFSTPPPTSQPYWAQNNGGEYAPRSSQYNDRAPLPQSNNQYAGRYNDSQRYSSQQGNTYQQDRPHYPRDGAQSSYNSSYGDPQYPRFGSRSQDSSPYNHNRQSYQRQDERYQRYDRPQSTYSENQNGYQRDGWNGNGGNNSYGRSMEGGDQRQVDPRKQAPAVEEVVKPADNRRKKGNKMRDQEKRAFGMTQSFLVDESELLSKKEKKKKKREEPIPIFIPQFTSIANLAKLLKVPLEKFMHKLEDLGFENQNHDHVLGAEDAGLIAMEYNFDPIIDTSESEDLLPRPPPEDKSLLPPRPPVVTIMGHVDHGKTTLLDYLRKSSVAASEHGGITQHIGAFSVSMPSGKNITFLDTPGHAAFLTMRERGANATDIVILVVAADDSVKPQTIEAIKHAKSANVPIIVAVNKVDKHDADINKVKIDLAANGVEIEDYGGDTQVIPVSGKTGQGMQDLEEATVLLSEILDMRAETDGPCEGYILEATTKKRGRVATILVRRGTLRPGDILVAGQTWARVRNLLNEGGVEVPFAGPGTPVEVDGWRDQPDAGDLAIQATGEDHAKDVVSFRIAKADRLRQAADMEAINEARKIVHDKEKHEKLMVSDPEAASAAAEEAAEEARNSTKCELVNFVVKADVSGSVEAIITALSEIGNDEVRPKVIRSSFGSVSEFDVDHAAAANGIILSFNLSLDPMIINYARQKGVQIMQSNIIYRLTEEVTALLSEKLAPQITYRVTGEAEIIQIFDINVKKKVYKPVAGCRVKMGIVARNSRVRVRRKGEIVWDGVMSSLKNVQKDVTEMKQGLECGIGLEGFDAYNVGDVIQCYTEVKTKRALPPTMR